LIPGKPIDFFLLQRVQTALGLTQPPFQWAAVALFPGVKRRKRRRETNMVRSILVDEWSYNYISPYTFMPFRRTKKILFFNEVTAQ
jgi:hypothetical protein